MSHDSHIIVTPLVSSTQTPVIIYPGTESSSEDSGVPIAVFAGVIGAIVVVIILLVVVLIVVLSQKYKKRVVNCRCIHTVNSNAPQTLVFTSITSFVQYFRNCYTEQDLHMEANPVYNIHVHNTLRTDMR